MLSFAPPRSSSSPSSAPPALRQLAPVACTKSRCSFVSSNLGAPSFLILSHGRSPRRRFPRRAHLLTYFHAGSAGIATSSDLHRHRNCRLRIRVSRRRGSQFLCRQADSRILGRHASRGPRAQPSSCKASQGPGQMQTLRTQPYFTTVAISKCTSAQRTRKQCLGRACAASPIDAEAVQRMRTAFRSNYPGEHLDADAMPSIRLLTA